MCIGSVETGKPLVKVIHQIFTSSLTNIKSAMRATPGFVDFADLEEGEHLNEGDVDHTRLLLTCEESPKIDSRVSSLGVLELRGSIKVRVRVGEGGGGRRH